MELIIALALIVFVVLGAQGWLLFHLQRQGVGIQQRLDTLAQRDATQTLVPATIPPPVVREPAPPFDLADITGAPSSLERLLADEKPLVLFFTDAACGPCYALLPDIGGWQRVYGDRLSMALISGGTAEANRAMTAEYGIPAGSVLLQEGDHEIADRYGVNMMPAALVIRPDGRRAGEVAYGTQGVRRLVAATLGLTLPEAPERPGEVLRIGERVPTLRRPDLDGNAIDFGDRRGESTLLLFWSPGCTHCHELLSDIKAWEEDVNGPRMIVVSRGPVELNRAAELRSTIVLDDEGAIGSRFGVVGTPAAVVIDGLGIIASEVVAGTNEVRSLVARRFAAAAAAAD